MPMTRKIWDAEANEYVEMYSLTAKETLKIEDGLARTKPKHKRRYFAENPADVKQESA